jgi:5-epi-alpha-selinene synthase
MEWRRQTSALYLFFDLIELSHGLSLRDDHLEHVQALRERANDGVSWFNDIVSLEKELRVGDVHNLVIVLRHERQLSLPEAVAQASLLLNARMREYVELEQQLPSLSAECNAHLQPYLMGLRSWVRGNMDWSYESGRYGHERLAGARSATAPEGATG